MVVPQSLELLELQLSQHYNRELNVLPLYQRTFHPSCHPLSEVVGHIWQQGDTAAFSASNDDELNLTGLFLSPIHTKKVISAGEGVTSVALFFYFFKQANTLSRKKKLSGYQSNTIYKLVASIATCTSTIYHANRLPT